MSMSMLVWLALPRSHTAAIPYRCTNKAVPRRLPSARPPARGSSVDQGVTAHSTQTSVMNEVEVGGVSMYESYGSEGTGPVLGADWTDRNVLLCNTLVCQMTT